MSRPTLDEVYLHMLKVFALRGTCARRKVAAIFCDQYGRHLSSGYNGPPRGFAHCIDTPCPGAGDAPGDTGNCQAVHAEQNAILNCTELDKVHTVYCSCTPCFTCAKMLANMPSLVRVIVTEMYSDRRGFEILEQRGIIVKEIHEPSESISGADESDIPF